MESDHAAVGVNMESKTMRKGKYRTRKRAKR